MKKITALSCLFCMSFIFAGCIRPGSLMKLEKSGIPYPRRHGAIILPNASGKKFSFQYLGCGGLYLIKDGDGILIDPFFSNIKMGRLGKSTLLGKQVISSNRKMVDIGWKAIQGASGKQQPDCILSVFTRLPLYVDGGDKTS
jgi:hypothetical protein